MSNTFNSKADWNVVRMLEFGTDYFAKKSIPSPRLSIEWLLSFVLGVKRLDLYLQYDRPLSESELKELKPYILRRARHEPLQYILGETDFHNITIGVGPGVLIPRPETEQLVEFVLQDAPESTPFTLLDAGTGSGCIALAIKNIRPQASITAIDISEQALEIAKKNSEKLQLPVFFECGDIGLYQTPSRFDYLVSNPPYIGQDEKSGLDEQVIRYEPKEALLTENVTDIYRQLAGLCARVLKPGGSFYFEINDLHAVSLCHLFNKPPFTSTLKKDIAGKQRFIVGKIEQ